MPDPIQPDPAAGTPKADDGTIVTTPTPTEPKADAAKVDAPKVTDTKPAEPQPAKKVVPEKYNLALPKDSLLDPTAIEEISSFAKENGLSNEEAQDILEGESVKLAAHVDKLKEKWSTEWKNDKEIGGAEFEKNAELAKRVIDRFGTDGLKNELNKWGYGNHPELGRLLVKIGKAMAEDTLRMPGSQPAGEQRKSLAEVLYPNQKE